MLLRLFSFPCFTCIFSFFFCEGTFVLLYFFVGCSLMCALFSCLWYTQMGERRPCNITLGIILVTQSISTEKTLVLSPAQSYLYVTPPSPWPGSWVVEAWHCNILQHNAAHCSALQHTATYCNKLQHTATQTDRHRPSYESSQRFRNLRPKLVTATHCNTLQHTATHCNTLQHTASQTDRDRPSYESSQRRRNARPRWVMTSWLASPTSHYFTALPPSSAITSWQKLNKKLN